MSDIPYLAPKGKCWKINGNSEWVLINDPNWLDDDGAHHKNRATTNIVKNKKRVKGKKTHRGKNGRRSK